MRIGRAQKWSRETDASVHEEVCHHRNYLENDALGSGEGMY